VQYLSYGVDVGIFAGACRGLVKGLKGTVPKRHR